jgi:hypothetical protein
MEISIDAVKINSIEGIKEHSILLFFKWSNIFEVIWEGVLSNNNKHY